MKNVGMFNFLTIILSLRCLIYLFDLNFRVYTEQSNDLIVFFIKIEIVCNGFSLK